MTVRLREVGNSMTITIPKEIIKSFNLRQGSEMSIEIYNDSIMVKPLRKTKITIHSLFQGYAENYKPTEIDWGERRGNEVW